MDGNTLTAKYKDRMKSAILVQILKLMEEHSVTFEELQNYQANNEIELRRQLLRIRKKQRMKEIPDGRRRG